MCERKPSLKKARAYEDWEVNQGEMVMVPLMMIISSDGTIS